MSDPVLSNEEKLVHLQNVLAAPLSFHMAWDKAQADGKVDLSDLPLLVEPGTKIPAAVTSLPHVWDAVKTLDEANSKKLNDWVKAAYDVADDEVEKKIEDGIALVMSLASYLAGWSKPE
jgi:hypothetical protein